MKTRFQIGLRSFLFLVTLACAVVAFRQFFIVAYQRQAQGKILAQKLGGSVETRLGQPEWLASVLGEENFQDVVMVHLEGRKLDDDDLLFLRDLPRMERLYLARTVVSNKGLVHLQLAKNLQRMSLWRTQIDDVGLRNLTKLSQLQALDLQHNQKLTDNSLETLAQLPNLKWVNLYETRVTRQGLDKLWAVRPELQVNLPQPLADDLEMLALFEEIHNDLNANPRRRSRKLLLGDSETGRLTNLSTNYSVLNLGTAELLVRLPPCPSMNFSYCTIEPGFLKKLSEVRGLTNLHLNRARLSHPDQVLELTKLSQLRVLTMQGIRCSQPADAQVAELRSRLPACQIGYGREGDRKSKPARFLRAAPPIRTIVPTPRITKPDSSR